MKKLLFMGFIIVGLFASIDINNASVKELSTLKGIGRTKAQAKVEYRKTHCFKNIDELTNVKGIGKKTIGKNRDEIKIGECSN